MTAPTVHFKTSIQSYLEALPMQTFHRIFLKPATCLAIFRLLPPLAKQLVMSLLYVDSAVSLDDVRNWCLPSAQRKQKEELAKLARVHILTDENGYLVMNSTFRTQLRDALTGGGNQNSFGLPCATVDKHKVDISYLDTYAISQWESILHFMVGSGTSKSPSVGVMNLLRRSGLMADPDGTGGLSITNKGFQFLLQDINTQLWAFLLQYLDAAEDLQMDIVEVLNFLFQLGSMELGSDYSVDTLTTTQLQMLDDLRDYGIVYQRKRTSRRFYPTRLATTLTSGSSAAAPSTRSAVTAETNMPTNPGYILLETNYRVYAYTDSPLQIAVLNLFISMSARFGNMIAGSITRESVRGALLKGITAEQIITYLSTHAHPQMRKKTPLLPLTVVDQIRLWEMERNRLKVQPGYLYSAFVKAQDYETVQKYANDVGSTLYVHPRRRLLVVTPDGHQQVRTFIHRKMADKKAQGNAPT